MKKLVLGMALLLVLLPAGLSSDRMDKGMPESGMAVELYFKRLLRVMDVLGDAATGLSPGEEARLAKVIVKESYASGLDPVFVLAMIGTESSFYNWAMSPRGAMGLMQLLPETAGETAQRLGMEFCAGDASGCADRLYDPGLNVKLGIHYFSRLMKRYNGDTDRALAAYNRGPNRVSATDNAPGLPLQAGEYVMRVNDNYKRLMERTVI